MIATPNTTNQLINKNKIEAKDRRPQGWSSEKNLFKKIKMTKKEINNINLHN